MNQKVKFVLFFSLFLFFSTASAKEKLLFSIDLIRHGDRTPNYKIPNSPHNWKEGLGEITEKGIHQQIQLGKDLRRKYVYQYHLLPVRYNPESLEAHATPIKRAIVSADSLLLGLYPAKTRPLAQNESIPIFKDNLLIVQPDKNIPSLIKLYFYNYQYWKKKTISQKKLRYWSKVTGIKLNNLQQLDSLADNLYVRQAHRIALPTGISRKDANQIITFSEQSTIHLFKLKEISHPTGHNILKTINNYLDRRIKKETPLRYVLFSGHDSSIMSLMNTLGVPLENIPGYASRLNFSLFQNKANLYVRVSYNDKIIEIPSCEANDCSLEDFHKFS